MARKRSDPAPGPTWGDRVRLRAAAHALAKTVLEAGGALDDAAVAATAAAQDLDVDALQRAVEATLADQRRRG